MWLYIFTILHKALVEYTNNYYDSLTIDGNLGTMDLEKRVKLKGAISSWIDILYEKPQRFCLIRRTISPEVNSMKNMGYATLG